MKILTKLSGKQIVLEDINQKKKVQKEFYSTLEMDRFLAQFRADDSKKRKYIITIIE